MEISVEIGASGEAYTYGLEKTFEKTLNTTVGLAQGYSYGNTPTGSLWYVYSQCFVEYLVKTYGMEKTLNLIRLGEDEGAYRKYLGKSFEEVKADWYTWLDGLELSMTIEELNKVEWDYLANYE